MLRQFYLLNSIDNVLEKYQTVNQEHFQNEIISELLLEVDFLPLDDLTVKIAFKNYVFNWFYSFLRAKSHDAVICIWKSRKAAKVNKLKVEKGKTKMKYLIAENGSDRSYGELWNQENEFRTSWDKRKT